MKCKRTLALHGRALLSIRYIVCTNYIPTWVRLRGGLGRARAVSGLRSDIEFWGSEGSRGGRFRMDVWKLGRFQESGQSASGNRCLKTGSLGWPGFGKVRSEPRYE